MESHTSTQPASLGTADAQSSEQAYPSSQNFTHETPRFGDNVVDVDFASKDSTATDGGQEESDHANQNQSENPSIPDDLQELDATHTESDCPTCEFPLYDKSLAPQKDEITLTSREILNLAATGHAALRDGENLYHLLWTKFYGDRLIKTGEQIREVQRSLSVLRKDVRTARCCRNDREKWSAVFVEENSLPKLPIEKRVEVALLFIFCAVLLAFGFYSTAALLIATGNPLFPDFWHAAPLASGTVILAVSLKSVFQILPEGPAQKRWTRTMYAVGLPLAAIWLILFIAQFGGSIAGSGEGWSVDPEVNVFDQLPLLTGLNLKMVNVACQAAQVGAEAILSAALWCTGKLMIPTKTYTSKRVLSPEYVAAEEEYLRKCKQYQYGAGLLAKLKANKETLVSQREAGKQKVRQKIKAIQLVAA